MDDEDSVVDDSDDSFKDGVREELFRIKLYKDYKDKLPTINEATEGPVFPVLIPYGHDLLVIQMPLHIIRRTLDNEIDRATNKVQEFSDDWVKNKLNSLIEDLTKEFTEE